MKIAKMRRALRKLTGSAARARRAAEVLDEVVNAQVSSLPRLPEDARRGSADHLAELVALAGNYRLFAAGWISDRELRRRGQAILARVELSSFLPMEQLIERE